MTNLDAEVAAKVMGWRSFKLGTQGRNDTEEKGWIGDGCGQYGRHKSGFRPSINIAAAWLVIEKMRERGNQIVITSHSPSITGSKAPPRWAVSMVPGATIITENLPEAICRAALAAMGAK